MVQREASRRVYSAFCYALMLGVLGGCGGANGTGGDPGAAVLPAGETCQSVRDQLNKLDRKGAQASVEAQSAGRKLSASQKADADAYNRLLNEYLGSRCHV